MTTDHDLLAKIGATLSAYIKESGATHDVITCIKALRAVVVREEKEVSPAQQFWATGYNQCLADIKADIEKELGCN